MEPEQVAGIVKSLTKAQRALVLCLNGNEFRDWGGRGMPGNRATREAIRSLVTCADVRWMVRLNETGLAVRSALAKENDRGE